MTRRRNFKTPMDGYPRNHFSSLRGKTRRLFVMFSIGSPSSWTVPAARETSRRRRALNTAVEYAIERQLLTEKPLTAIKEMKSFSSDRVDPRVLVNKTQAAQLLSSVSYVGKWDRKKGRRLVGFYAVMYFTGLRPSEAVGLSKADCFLPEKGWGILTLRDTHPVSGRQWTDSGERHDKRGLKSRGQGRPTSPDPPAARGHAPRPPQRVRYDQGWATLHERAERSRGQQYLLARVAGCPGVCTSAGPSGVHPRGAAVRPAAYLHHHMAERWSACSRGGAEGR